MRGVGLREAALLTDPKERSKRPVACLLLHHGLCSGCTKAVGTGAKRTSTKTYDEYPPYFIAV